MRRLPLVADRIAFLVGLSIGEGLNVQYHSTRSNDAMDGETFTAEVIEQRPNLELPHESETDVQVEVPGIAGGKIVTLLHADAETALVVVHGSVSEGQTRVREVTGWFQVADEQPLYFDEDADDPSGFMAGVAAAEAEAAEVEAVAEDKAETPAAPQAGTAIATMVLPRGAQWLMTEAALLEAEAAKYSKFGNVYHYLRSAASALRGAVGHALAGDAEQV